MHTSATASRSATALGFIMTISSSLVIADPVTKDIDDLDVLNVRDSIPDVVEMFHIIPKTFLMFLSDGLQL
jgi:hypothetical protein